MSALQEMIATLQAAPPEVRDEMMTLAAGVEKPMMPNEGPQTDAYFSQAEVMLYGGQAGGGKTFLELGWGINEADAGIIFRRQRNQTDGLETEGKRLIGNRASFNGQDLEWTWPDGRSLKLAGMNQPDDWMDHAGRERDYMGFDEAGEFLEMQVAQIIAWLRAGPGKRCRAILGSNPPRTAEGAWLRKWFAPWLDPKFPFPATPGEVRWAVGVTKGDVYDLHWVEGPGEYEIEGKTYTARSYTFIPASLEDNPFRNTPDYRARLQSLPEPLRSQLLHGDFTAGAKDDIDQCIPTAWILAAQERWEPNIPWGVPMCAIGADASGGGDDPMVMSARHDGWFAPLDVVPGADLPIDRMGTHCAGLVVARRRDGAKVKVDLGGGYGNGIYEHLKGNGVEVEGHKGAKGTLSRTKDRQLGFFNERARVIWQFREALDPDQEGGSPIALPPDPLLVADLTAPRFSTVSHRKGMAIKVEDKESVCKRLGRSTDRGDAVVMAWSVGDKLRNVKNGDWGEHRRTKVIPKVNVSHANRRKR